MIRSRKIAAIVLTLALFVGCASASPAGWVFLGERVAAKGGDHDEIQVGVKDGHFAKIQIRVKETAVEIRDLKVHYANGTTEDVQIRALIAAGGESRVIDLKGNGRVIDKVTFWYHTPARARGRAMVRLFGMR